MAKESLPDAIHNAFSKLSAAEVELLAAAMLHGVPLRQILAGSRLDPDAVHEEMIGALRKLRAALDEQGHTAQRLQESVRQARER